MDLTVVCILSITVHANDAMNWWYLANIYMQECAYLRESWSHYWISVPVEHSCLDIQALDWEKHTYTHTAAKLRHTSVLPPWTVLLCRISYEPESIKALKWHHCPCLNSAISTHKRKGVQILSWHSDLLVIEICNSPLLQQNTSQEHQCRRDA